MVVILDTGHGGVINGEYQTRGKRSPDWDKGVLYEGMFNRWVANRITEKLDRLKIPYYHISPEHKDVTLQTRVNRANKIFKSNPNTYLYSIHANGGGGFGIEGFTSRGNTKSDKMAELFLKAFQDSNINKMRLDYSDGDMDKESGFYILRKTNCPAVLLELGFMDNIKDYDKLWSSEYLSKLVDIQVKVIQNIYKNGVE